MNSATVTSRDFDGMVLWTVVMGEYLAQGIGTSTRRPASWTVMLGPIVVQQESGYLRGFEVELGKVLRAIETGRI